MTDTSQRGDALPYGVERFLHLIIYSKVSQQHMEQNEHGHCTYCRHQPSSPREATQDDIERRPSAFKECSEDTHLQQERQTRNQYDDERVDGTLRHNGTQCLGKRYAVPPFEHATACELSDARYDERHGIADEDGVDGYAGTRTLVQRLQREQPAPTAKGLGHDTEGE